jgi:hypothetical protein
MAKSMRLLVFLAGFVGILYGVASLSMLAESRNANLAFTPIIGIAALVLFFYGLDGELILMFAAAIFMLNYIFLTQALELAPYFNIFAGVLGLVVTYGEVEHG